MNRAGRASVSLMRRISKLRVPDEAHGEVAKDVIEVDLSAVQAFLGNWRAITRREACVPVRIRAVESLHSRSNPRHLTEPDYDPKRRARLAYACWGVRNLLCDVLGFISA